MKGLFAFNYSNREWIFIIVLILVISKFIDFIAYTYSSNENVIGYVSFASTLASIILAVLAIIYGFLQSHQQSIASLSMVSQVETLSKVLIDIQSNNDKFNKDINKIDGIMNTLNFSFEEIKNLRSSHEGFTSKFEGFLKDLSHNKVILTGEDQKQNSLKNNINLFLAEDRSLFDVTLLLLFLFEGKKVTLDKLSDKYLSINKNNTNINHRIAGFIDATAVLINRSGFLNHTDEGFSNLDNHLREHVSKKIMEVDFNNDNPIDRILNQIKINYSLGET